MKVAITGHRPNKLWNDYSLKSSRIAMIKTKLQQIIDSHIPTEMISGMALGVDTLWAILAIENGIKLTAAIPFKGQENKWLEDSIIQYRNICTHPDTSVIEVCDPGYAAWKMQKRNEWMVDNCDLLVAVWDGTKGGTGNCVEYAKKMGKKILRINPRNYDNI